ncbi:MAG: hypothetical protein UHN88_02135 [Eubacterium sp.]|nr:hypothetical protein [Eubacterium sp.]
MKNGADSRADARIEQMRGAGRRIERMRGSSVHLDAAFEGSRWARRLNFVCWTISQVRASALLPSKTAVDGIPPAAFRSIICHRMVLHFDYLPSSGSLLAIAGITQHVCSSM